MTSDDVTVRPPATPRPKRWARRATPLAVTALGAALVAGTAAPASAFGPTNHIYVSYHGLPSYSVDVTYYSYYGDEVSRFSTVVIGGKKLSYAWDPTAVGSVHIDINSGTATAAVDFTSSFYTYDHCFLVEAFGNIELTGDNTTGCNGE